MTLRYHFVIDEPDRAKVEKLSTINPDEYPSLFWRGDLAWCLQSYLRLSLVGRPVTCGNSLVDDGINIVHGKQLRQLKATAKHFLVCARADFPPCRWAHFQLVQNRLQLGRNTVYVPHWPQPGIRPRDDSRTTVQHVAYSGLTYNGNMAGTVEQWSASLRAEGFEFSVLTGETTCDLRHVDVMVAVRSFDQRTYSHKPPSKLFNAWAARTPLIGGYDSAFSQVGRPGVDYIRVKSLEEAVIALRRLRDEPVFYRDIVQSGTSRFRQYESGQLTQYWWDILAGPIRERYQRWQRHTVRESIRRRVVLGYERPISALKSWVRTAQRNGLLVIRRVRRSDRDPRQNI